MVVTAKHWVKYGTEWHMGGESFEIEDEDFEGMKEHIETEYVSEVFPPEKPKKKTSSSKKK